MGDLIFVLAIIILLVTLGVKLDRLDREHEKDIKDIWDNYYRKRQQSDDKERGA